MRAMSCGALVLTLGGCATTSNHAAGSDAAPTAAAYYPLAVGNQWIYEADVLGEKREETVQIQDLQGGFFRDSQHGELTADAYGVRDQKRYLLRDPLETGREWTNVVSVSSVEHYKVLEADIQCDAPAGKFEHCVRVEGRNRIDPKTTLVNRMTFAPGVGIVRVEVVAEVNGKAIPQTRLALKSFKLAPAPAQK